MRKKKRAESLFYACQSAVDKWCSSFFSAWNNYMMGKTTFYWYGLIGKFPSKKGKWSLDVY